MLIVEKDFLYGNVQESLLLLDPFWGVLVQTTKKITIWSFFVGLSWNHEIYANSQMCFC
jgi:hypothetical protein